MGDPIYREVMDGFFTGEISCCAGHNFERRSVTTFDFVAGSPSGVNRVKFELAGIRRLEELVQSGARVRVTVEAFGDPSESETKR